MVVTGGSSKQQKLFAGFLAPFIIVNCLGSFQINAIPVFDKPRIYVRTNMESKRCPWWIRTGFLLSFGGVAFLRRCGCSFSA
uniref:Uncharacterized protein n=1 Tax=Populus trichocarpa TaxID=3694 RepID=B9HR03_POPTR